VVKSVSFQDISVNVQLRLGIYRQKYGFRSALAIFFALVGFAALSMGVREAYRWMSPNDVPIWAMSCDLIEIVSSYPVWGLLVTLCYLHKETKPKTDLVICLTGLLLPQVIYYVTFSALVLSHSLYTPYVLHTAIGAGLVGLAAGFVLGSRITRK
jgi:hypothetical protein